MGLGINTVLALAIGGSLAGIGGGVEILGVATRPRHVLGRHDGERPEEAPCWKGTLSVLLTGAAARSDGVRPAVRCSWPKGQGGPWKQRGAMAARRLEIGGHLA